MMTFSRTAFLWMILITHLCTGLPAFGHGDTHVLIDQLSLQLETQPDNIELLLQRANLLRQHGDYDLAMQDLDRLDVLAPDRSERIYQRARIFVAQKQWEAARQALDRYIAIQNESSEPYSLRSWTLWQLGELKLAEQDALQAIALQKNPSLQLHLNYIALLKVQDKIEDTLLAYAQAEQALGANPVLLIGQAEYLWELEQFEDASLVYGRLRKHQPLLGFRCWLSEAEMWSEADPCQAMVCAEAAALAWQKLSSRQHQAQRADYERLLKLEISLKNAQN